MAVYVIVRKGKDIQFINAKNYRDAFQQAAGEYKTGFTVREPTKAEQVILKQKIREILHGTT